MLFYLSRFSDFFGPLNVFQYVTFRSMGAALTALMMTLLMGPTVIRMLTRLKVGQPTREKEEVHKLAELHGGKTGTPTMGGAIILAAVTVGCLLWARLDNPYVWLTWVAMVFLGALGFWDDYKKIRKQKSSGISSKQKLIGQILIGAGIGVFLMVSPASMDRALQLQAPFLKEPLFQNMGVFALFFMILVVVGSSNAVNLTDGLDGLAIGCTAIVVMAFLVLTYIAGHARFAAYLQVPYVAGAGELTVLCGAVFGASLGFLWFNCHPAQVFMGDTGSLALGGLLGIIAVLIQQPFALFIAGGVFVLEAVSVILQVLSAKYSRKYLKTDKRIFLRAPIHHHFEKKGWYESKVVIRFYILSILCAVVALATLKMR